MKIETQLKLYYIYSIMGYITLLFSLSSIYAMDISVTAISLTTESVMPTVMSIEVTI